MTIRGSLHERAVFGRRVRRLGTLLAPLIPEGATVLDVGCGDGSVAVEIGARRPDVDIEGVDVLVRPEAKIEVTGYDGTTLPFADASFGAVCFVDVLHHTDDPLRMLSEAARVSRGPVIVKDHLTDSLLAGPTLRIMDSAGNAHHGVRLPYRYLSTRQWCDVAGAAGLEIDEWSTDLRLYPPPLTWCFDRQLHVVFSASRSSVSDVAGGDPG